MRPLTETLLAAQQSQSRLPALKIRATNKINGVVRLDWESLYSGTETVSRHAAVLAADGSLIRVRVTPPDDGGRLFRQRVGNPGPASDFSGWTDTGQYNAGVVACAGCGDAVYIFWINAVTREIFRLASADYGANWGTPELIGYSVSTAVTGIAVAVKPDGDTAVFYTDQSTLYIMQCIDNEWQPRTAWDKTTGALSGVSCVYDGDWCLLVSGRDGAGNYKVWSLMLGDGESLPAGTWSALNTIIEAAADAGFEYGGVTLDKPDVFRIFFTEKFTGSETNIRSYWSYIVPGVEFNDSLWREPVPFGLEVEYGAALIHSTGYAWLSSACRVWRAALAERTLDISDGVLSLKHRQAGEENTIVLELSNESGTYTAPDSLPENGNQLEFSPGYHTGEGVEYSDGLAFKITSRELYCSSGQNSLRLEAAGGWETLQRWRARRQFRWNKGSSEMNIEGILEIILARSGFRLVVNGESAAISDTYPDFTVHPGNRGDEVVNRLLSLVPDLIFFEGNTAYLVNPQSTDIPVYAYGGAHVITEGRYRVGSPAINRVRVLGEDILTVVPVIADAFDWTEINRSHDVLKSIEDWNIGSAAEAALRAQAVLNKVLNLNLSGIIRAPLNCGLQLYDVVELTDNRAGLDCVKRRVLGIEDYYDSHKKIYEQVLRLGDA